MEGPVLYHDEFRAISIWLLLCGWPGINQVLPGLPEVMLQRPAAADAEDAQRVLLQQLEALIYRLD